MQVEKGADAIDSEGIKCRGRYLWGQWAKRRRESDESPIVDMIDIRVRKGEDHVESEGENDDREDD